MTSSFCGNIDFRIVSGHGLKAADANGKSDPYCELTLLDIGSATSSQAPVKFYSDRVLCSVDPVWPAAGAMFRWTGVKATGSNPRVHIGVFDYDRCKHDDPLGMVDVPLSDLLSGVSGKQYALAHGKIKVTARATAANVGRAVDAGEGRLNSPIAGITLQPSTKVRVGLAWDLADPTKPVDLDLSAICLTTRAQFCGVCYFGGLAYPNQALMHSGDAVLGTESEHSDDEIINADLSKFDKRVQYIGFVVTGDLAVLTGISNATVSAYVDDVRVYQAPLSGLDGASGLVHSMLIRQPDNSWRFLALGRPIEQGGGLSGSVTPLHAALVAYRGGSGGLVRPRRFRVIGKSDIVNLEELVRSFIANAVIDEFPDRDPSPDEINPIQFKPRFQCTLRWYTVAGTRVDLDSNIQVFKADFSHMFDVSYQKLTGPGGCIKHQGDNTQGLSIPKGARFSGSDHSRDLPCERIDVFLDMLPAEAKYLVVTTVSYSGHLLRDLVGETTASIVMFKDDGAEHLLVKAAADRRRFTGGETGFMLAVLRRVGTAPGWGSWELRPRVVGTKGMVAGSIHGFLQTNLRAMYA